LLVPILADTRRADTGLAAKGYVQRLVNNGEKEYSGKKGNHSNDLEDCGDTVKENEPLTVEFAKKDRLMYLGASVWRTITEIN